MYFIFLGFREELASFGVEVEDLRHLVQEQHHQQQQQQQQLKVQQEQLELQVNAGNKKAKLA